jgi:hypothetical protein
MTNGQNFSQPWKINKSLLLPLLSEWTDHLFGQHWLPSPKLKS